MTTRVFVYNEIEYDDPNPALGNEQVRDLLARTFPMLSGGEIETREDGERTVIEFKPRAKRKGLLMVTPLIAQKPQVEDILARFDFSHVHDAMMKMGWTWWFDEHNQRIPTLDELKEEADRLLRYARQEEVNISTGGLNAYWNDGVLRLAFEIESCVGKEEEVV